MHSGLLSMRDLPSHSPARATTEGRLGPTPGPKRIGTLNISTTGEDGGINLVNSQAVSAGRVLENIPDAVIAVPEPPMALGLVSASALLGWLHRRRQR